MVTPPGTRTLAVTPGMEAVKHGYNADAIAGMTPGGRRGLTGER